MDLEEKVLENKWRRKAERMGYVLAKSRAKDPDSFSFGGFKILDRWTGGVLAGDEPFDFCMTFDEVQRWITKRGPNPPKGKVKGHEQKKQTKSTKGKKSA
jgi:hypothetical protein